MRITIATFPKDESLSLVLQSYSRIWSSLSWLNLVMDINLLAYLNHTFCVSSCWPTLRFYMFFSNYIFGQFSERLSLQINKQTNNSDNFLHEIESRF